MGSGVALGQGNENFTNIPANNGSYSSRSWTGTDGVDWTADNARTDQTLNSRAICTKAGKVTSHLYTGGMGSLTFEYVRGFTSSSARGIKVFVNGVQIGSDISVSSSSNTSVIYSQLVNITGSVELKLQTTGAQVIIDDISWTSYSATSCTEPTTQATAASFSSITNNSMNLSWTAGDGTAGRIVVMKETSAFSGSPTSGTSYTANSTFGSGATIATDEFVVYKGTGNSVTVTGLDCGKTYHASVFEYNTTGTCYNVTSPATANETTTLTTTPTLPSSTQSCGSTVFAATPNAGTNSTYWQTSSSGVSTSDPANVTKTVTTNTTIYLRTQSGQGCWSDALTVNPTVILAPVISVQPANQSESAGQDATFSVTASDASSYQWQVSTNSGGSWANISGETSASITLTSVTLGMDGNQYRVNVGANSPCSSVTSSVGTLSVVNGPCLDEANFTSTPVGWTETSISYSSNEANFGNTSGELTTLQLSNPNQLTFDLRRSGNSNAKSLLIEISTTTQGGSYTIIATYDHSTTTSGSTTSCTVDLSAYSSNPNVYIKFRKVSSTASPWYLKNVQVFCGPSSPTLTTTQTTLSNLDYTVGSGPSANQTFDLTGSNLDNTDVTLSLSNTNHEFSLDNSTWSITTLSLPSYSGAAQTVYVRLKSGLSVANYTSVISISGGGVATAITVNLSGDVQAVFPPVITSAITQSVVYGSSTTYSIIASQSPTSYGATGLPTGLFFNASTGIISGTPTANVGTVTSTITATNAGGTDSKTLVWTITPKPLTMTGISGMNKVYDGNTSASLSGVGSEVLVGVVGSDFVYLPATGMPSATFLNKNIGTGKSLTVTGYNLVGTHAGNYTLTIPTLTANITPFALTVSGSTANNKVYDGTNSATISGGTLSGVISPDVVTLNGGGTFANANVGNAKAVTASLSLSGGGAGNYTLNQPTGLTANITKATPVFTTSAISINLGGTYVLPGSNVSSTSPGAFSYSITGGGNATLSGTTITGVVVGTETLTVNQAASINFIAGSTTVAVNVTSFAYLNGDVRTTADYTGLSYNSDWEEFNGSTWAARANSPQSNVPSGRIIIENQSIDGGANVSSGYNDIIIKSGGSLILSDNPGAFVDFIKTGKTLEIRDGGKLTLNGEIQLNSNANLIVRSGGILELNNDAIDNTHPLWNGKENFEQGSFVVINNWNWTVGSPGNLSLLSNGSSQISNNIGGYKFGNLSIEAELPDNWTLISGSTSPLVPLCEDDLEIFNTSPTFFISGTSNNYSGFIINGNLTIYDGWFNFGTKFSGTNGFSNNYVVRGNFVCLSDDKLKLHEIYDGVTTSTGSLTVHGNFEIGDQVPNFTNHGTKKIILKGGTAGSSKYIDIATSVLYIPIEIEDGSRVLKNNDLTFGNNSSLLVKNGASLDFGFNSSGGANQILSIGTGDSFTAQLQSVLYLTSPAGIMSSGATGNVQTSTRTFASASPYGDYHYIGKASQNTGTALPTDVRNLFINTETATHNVTLTQNVIVNNTLTMSSGNIQTGANLLELGESTTNKGTLTHTSGFVVGKMRRWFAGTNSGDASGLFPMGFDDGGLKNRNAKVEFNLAPIGGHLTVEYINSPMISIGSYVGLPILAINTGGAGFDVTTTEDQGYWKIDNEAGKLILAAYTISLTGQGYATVNDLTNLTLLKRVGIGNWLAPGTHIAASGTTAMPTVSRSGIIGWSNFGFGGGSNNALPVTLTTFEVVCSANDKQMDINWSTASETNSSHFTVEKSRDMVNWATISKVEAAGNSSHNIDYKEIDKNPWNGITYYRLSQFDFDGEIEAFDPISVSCVVGENSVVVYPNPSNGEFTLEITWTEKPIKTQLEIIDVTGRTVLSQDIKLEEGVKQIYFNQIDLQSGTYLIVFPNTELKPIRVLIDN